MTARESDVHVVARVLAGGHAGPHHRETATRLIATLGGLRALARAGRARLLDRGSLAEAEADAILAALAFERALRTSRAEAASAPRMRDPESIGRWAIPRLASLDHEEVWVLVFGVKQQLLCARRIFQGGIHTVPIHLPSLLREVIAEGGARFVLVHNHPSGDPSPSPEDVAVTERIAHAAATVGVPLVDHVVVASSAWACVPFRGGP